MIWLRFGYSLVTFWLRFGYGNNEVVTFWLLCGYGLVTVWLRLARPWNILVTNAPATLQLPATRAFVYVLVMCIGMQHNHIIWLQLLGYDD